MATHIIDGTIAAIGEGQSWPSGFSKVTAIIAEGGSDRDPDRIPVEFQRNKYGDDMIAALAGCSVGDTVRVRCALRGREWQGRHFLSIVATGIERIASSPGEATAPQPGTPQQASLPNVPPPPPQAPAPPAPAPTDGYNPNLDDLPF